MNLSQKISQYLTWADTAISKIVSALTDEEFNQQFRGSGGSIRQRYVHLAEDNWEWYHEWMQDNPSDEPNCEEMSREELFQFISKYNHLWAELATSRLVENLELSRRDVSISVTLEEFIFHIANHATYHRGQIVMGLRLLGKDVHMTDYVPFRFSTT